MSLFHICILILSYGRAGQCGAFQILLDPNTHEPQSALAMVRNDESWSPTAFEGHHIGCLCGRVRDLSVTVQVSFEER